jgi:MinD superfamily P-loop ATPase
MKKITILSGKGGVGKSSISASLALSLSKKYKIITADCDVDASNLALVLGKKEKDFKEWDYISTNQKAVFDLDKCISCGKCAQSCYFKAIDWVDNKPKLKPFSCEGCEVCKTICPVGAISMEKVNNAKIGYVESDYGFKVVSAQLEPGESGSGKLVSEVRQKAENLAEDADYTLIDAAAGIGCPVIASVSGVDFCLLVSEPTPSGLADIKRAFEIVQHFNIKSGLIINKFDINEEFCKKLEEFAHENKIEIITKLAYNKIFTKALVEMKPVILMDDDLKEQFEKISEKVVEIIV